MRTKRAHALLQEAAQEHDGQLALCDQIRGDLEGRGVAPDLCEMLARDLEPSARDLSPEHYDVMLDGVALACGMGAGAGQEVVRNAAEVREVERMMHSFAGELSKLDETLEVLAAYVRRMRTHAKTRGTEALH